MATTRRRAPRRKTPAKPKVLYIGVEDKSKCATCIETSIEAAKRELIADLYDDQTATIYKLVPVSRFKKGGLIEIPLPHTDLASVVGDALLEAAVS